MPIKRPMPARSIKPARAIKIASFMAATAMGLAVLGMPFAAPANAQTAPLCLSTKTSASGRSAGEPLAARLIAQTAWERKVRNAKSLGPRYARWSRARQKSIVCRRISTRNFCVASATPCRTGRSG
jgi:hypothetical protein